MQSAKTKPTDGSVSSKRAESFKLGLGEFEKGLLREVHRFWSGTLYVQEQVTKKEEPKGAGTHVTRDQYSRCS